MGVWIIISIFDDSIRKGMHLGLINWRFKRISCELVLGRSLNSSIVDMGLIQAFLKKDGDLGSKELQIVNYRTCWVGVARDVEEILISMLKYGVCFLKEAGDCYIDILGGLKEFHRDIAHAVGVILVHCSQYSGSSLCISYDNGWGGCGNGLY